jgi:tetratricopeptide (TPR) repeat protein
MRTHVSVLNSVILLWLASCGGASKPAARDTTAPKAAGATAPAAEEEDEELYSMARIFEALEQSSMSYSIHGTSEELRMDLSAAEPDAMLDPYLALQKGANGAELVRAEPPGTIAALFERAANRMNAGDMAEALALYEQAVKQEPSYFKAHTYVGNLYFFQKDYRRAESHFLRAIELNPIDYQAYFFLADTYRITRRPREALRTITTAFLLNRNNPRIVDLLAGILLDNDLSLRTDRFVIPARIEKKGENIEITLPETEGTTWMPLVMCMAAWLHEPAFRPRWEGQHEIERDRRMYRECLVNQVYIFDEELEKGARLPEPATYLHRAILDGHLSSIVFWELLAPRTPVVIPLLPVEERERIAAYIEKYVYVAR